MNLVKRPEKYRCGVAISTVTDLLLMFSSSDWMRSEKAVASMKRVVGYPQTQLRTFSPVYRYQRLKRPLLLIYGNDDMRVSYERIWRLYSLLAAAGQAPALSTPHGADHQMSRSKDQLAMCAVGSDFLQECLRPPAPAAANTL